MGKGGKGKKGGGGGGLKRQNTDDCVKAFKKPRILPADPMVESEVRAYARTKQYNVSNMNRDFEKDAPSSSGLRTAIANANAGGGCEDAQASAKAEALADATDVPTVLKLLGQTSPNDVEKWSEVQLERVRANVQRRFSAITTWSVAQKGIDMFALEWPDFPLVDDRSTLSIMLLTRAVDICRQKRQYKKKKNGQTTIVDEEDNTVAIASSGIGKTVEGKENETMPELEKMTEVITWLGKYPVLQAQMGSLWTKLSTLTPTEVTTTITNYLAANDHSTATAQFLLKIETMAKEASANDAKAGVQDALHRGGLNRPVTAAEKQKLKTFGFTVSDVFKAISDSGSDVISVLQLSLTERTNRIKRVKVLILPVLGNTVEKIGEEMAKWSAQHLTGDRKLLLCHVLDMEWATSFKELKTAVCDAELVSEIRAGMKKEWSDYAEVASSMAESTAALAVATTKIVKTASTLKRSFISPHAVVILSLKSRNPTAADLADVKAFASDANNALWQHHNAAVVHLGSCIQKWQKKLARDVMASVKQEAINLKVNNATTVKQCKDWYQNFEGNHLIWGLDRIEVHNLNSEATWIKDVCREAADEWRQAMEAANSRNQAQQNGVAAPAGAGVGVSSLKVVAKGPNF